MNRAALLGMWMVGASAFAGCSGAEGGEELGDGAQDEAISTRTVPGVVAIEFRKGDQVITLGAKSKVARAMRAMKRVTPGVTTPLCGFGPATQITFYNADAEKVATGDLHCFRGSVKPTHGREIAIYTQPGDLNVLSEAPVPADALWGISKVAVKKLGEGAGTRTTTSKEVIRDIVDGYKPNQEIDTDYLPPRCMPTYTVEFLRKREEVAYSSFLCGQDVPSQLTADFRIPGAKEEAPDVIRGGIKVDPRPVVRLFE